MVNFSPLAAEIVSLVWGTPANFNGFHILAALLHSQTAALNRGRHLYSAGQLSRWALAHISSSIYYDLQHPPCSNYVRGNLFAQSAHNQPSSPTAEKHSSVPLQFYRSFILQRLLLALHSFHILRYLLYHNFITTHPPMYLTYILA